MTFLEWEAALDASYPAQPSQVPAIRSAVAAIARERGAGQHTVVQIKLAVSEAATNAVLHAYRDPVGAGEVRVVVRAHDKSALDIRCATTASGRCRDQTARGSGWGSG
jgi:anti-sigma regulatory factor (Ser/Thr protein kinase)